MWGPLTSLLARHRRLLSRLVLLVAVLVVALELWPRVPRDTDLEFALGPGHERVVELRVAYLVDGEELHGVAFDFPAGAPDRVRHRVSLPAGEYQLKLELRSRGGRSRQLIRRLKTPVEGLVTIQLEGSS